MHLRGARPNSGRKCVQLRRLLTLTIPVSDNELILHQFMANSECETCGKQDLLHLSCNRCASPVCGDCVSGKCGVCGADLQLAFRGEWG